MKAAFASDFRCHFSGGKEYREVTRFLTKGSNWPRTKKKGKTSIWMPFPSVD